MPTKIEGRTTDGRYNKPVNLVDKGAMSSNRIPLPLKQKYKSNQNSLKNQNHEKEHSRNQTV